MNRMILATALAVPSLAFALEVYDPDLGPPNTIEVGEVDPFLEAALLPNSAEQTEIDYVTQALLSMGVEYDSFTIKLEDLTALNTIADPSIIAADISPYMDDYYLVKNSTTWSFHENLTELMWAVLDTGIGTVPVYEYDYVNGELVVVGESEGDWSELLNLSATQLEISHISLFTGEGDGEDPPNGVPVPAPLALLGLGLAALGATRKR